MLPFPPSLSSEGGSEGATGYGQLKGVLCHPIIPQPPTATAGSSVHVVASAGKRWTEIGKCSILQKCIEIALVRIIVFWNFIASYASYASITKKE